MKVHQIPQFDGQKPSISINLYGYEEKELFPVYITKEKKENYVLVGNGEKQRYCLIRNFSRLLSSCTKHNGQLFIAFIACMVLEGKICYCTVASMVLKFMFVPKGFGVMPSCV